MATKHINDELWHRIEVLTVRANARQNLIRPVKEADVLHLVLQRGLELLTDDDLLQLGKYRRPIGFVLRRPGMEMLKLDSRAELTGDEISAIQKLAADSSRTDI